MTCHLLHLRILRMPTRQKTNALLRSYISHLYSAPPQCANTKGPGERVETLLRTQTIHGMPIIILFFFHPWLCTLRVQLPTRPEVTRQIRSPRLSSSCGVF
jgi:hypothetical protein